MAKQLRTRIHTIVKEHTEIRSLADPRLPEKSKIRLKKAYETAGWNRLGKGWRIHFFLKGQADPICHSFGFSRSNSENFGTNFLKSLTDNMFCKPCSKKRKVPR